VFEDLGIQRAMRMRHIVICVLPRSTICFSTLSQELRDFRENFIEHKMYVLILSTNCVRKFLIVTITERDVIEIVHRSCVKCALFWPNFKETSIFLEDIRKILRYEIS